MNASYFPWRLFWKFFWTLFILLNVLFVCSLGIASYVFDFSFYTTRPLLFILCFLVLSALGSAWFGYRFVVPLRNVIIKALRIASKKYASEFDEEDVLIDQPGEYLELERALDKIRRKLQKRRLQLSHEREELKALISSMDEAIASVDLQQRLIFFNAQFAAQFTSRSEGADGAKLLTDSFREPEILSLFSRALQDGQPQKLQIKLFTRIDAQPKYFSVRVAPLREESSQSIYGALAVFHDITELKKAEQMRMEFVENASHELRTPLTSIKGFVETLREDVAAGKMEQAGPFLKTISKSVDRLTNLVNDMLAIHSLEANATLKIEAINPQVLTEEVLSRLGGLAVAKNLTVRTSFESEQIQVDVEKVEQVLSNLIGNSIKYTQDGGMLTITWQNDSDGNTLLIVSDNGPGIAPEHQVRLFERFYRIDKGRSRDVGGTGLGLSIVKHIMQSHGGSVSLRSQSGAGAQFTCTFPVRL